MTDTSAAEEEKDPDIELFVKVGGVCVPARVYLRIMSFCCMIICCVVCVCIVVVVGFLWHRARVTQHACECYLCPLSPLYLSPPVLCCPLSLSLSDRSDLLSYFWFSKQ